jgi:hypothetical protein
MTGPDRAALAQVATGLAAHLGALTPAEAAGVAQDDDTDPAALIEAQEAMAAILGQLADPGGPWFDLVGVSEIGEMRGTTRQAAGAATARPGFPAPVARMGMGAAWWRPAVEAYNAAPHNPGPAAKPRPA